MIIDKHFLAKYSPIPSNYDVANLLPYVSIAEKIWVIPIIGYDFYMELDEQVNAPSGGTLTPQNATLLTEGGLWQYLAFSTLLEALPFVWTRLTEAGIQLGKSDNSDSVSLKDLTLIQNHIRNQVEVQKEFVIKYLCSHTESFPLFDTSVCPDCGCGCNKNNGGLFTPNPKHSLYKPTKGCVSPTMVSSTSSSVDLSNYYTKSETDELIDEKIDLSDGFRIISAKARLQGDVNDDGYISISDETELSNRIRTGEGEWPEANYDVNLDGNVSIADMTLINNLILGRGELPLVVFDENPYLAVVKAFEDGKVPLVKATVGSKVYPMIVYKASSGLVNNDYTTYLSSAVYNDNLTMKVEYKEDSTYGVLSSNDIDLSNYYTKSEVNSLVDSATSGLPTPQEFIELEEELEGKADSTALTSVYQSLTSHTSDTSIHLTSGAVQTQINNSISGKADAIVVSALAEDVAANSYNIGELQDAMGDMALDSEVVHKGLTETITGNKTFSSDTTFNGAVTLLGQEAVIIGNDSLEDILQEKLDVTAYTPTDLSEYWTSAQTSSAITSAVSGKADTSSLEAVAFTGDYDDLYNKPSIPLITFDSQTGILTITNQ